MQWMEHDATERAERRRIARDRALTIKDEGNAFFRDGKYLEALDKYSLVLLLLIPLCYNNFEFDINTTSFLISLQFTSS